MLESTSTPPATAITNPWMQSKNMRDTYLDQGIAYQPSPLLRAFAHAPATPASLDPCCSAASREPERSTVKQQGYCLLFMARRAAALHRSHHHCQ
jgi:hypothetical protein